MNVYIPTRDDLERFIQRAVEKTIKETIPPAFQKATRKKWLTTDEVMEILQCSRRHMQHLRDSGQLPYHQHNKTIRYDIDEIENFLNRGKVRQGGNDEQ